MSSYHYIIVSLSSFMMNLRNTMTTSKVATSKDGAKISRRTIIQDEKFLRDGILTYTLATHTGDQSCNLYYSGVQISKQPVYRKFSVIELSSYRKKNFVGKKNIFTSNAFGPVLSVPPFRFRPIYTCPNPPFPSFLSSI